MISNRKVKNPASVINARSPEKPGMAISFLIL